MKNILIALLVIFSLACSNKAAEEAAKLKEETFKLHDEIMPISMNLEDLKANVMKKAEADTNLKAKALDISSALDKAYNDMEVWMPKLGEAAEMKDGEEKVKALTDLKIEGEKIKQSTNDAKKQAEEFLK
ncbi:hypothetical protein Emtol_3693 [Emticicia oligotrophica DSM 17448]|uniref:Uncharacterized protein n=1 Tax=Emticicia oligotrophica (strain DSM 17448 / CIP 109782 / MTCC 6937 / GPTSA100-15) TaxID=929562 RepID=A0ABM5N5R8_EMTOG|nr:MULTISPECIES: hypothetical protein [Emticicia]AFK04819.1 hypothetical protein Emtol_3693 [Emticicia oligotrophica DSM 17448]